MTFESVLVIDPPDRKNRIPSRQSLHPPNISGFLIKKKAKLDQKCIGIGGLDYELLIGLPWTISSEEFRQLTDFGDVFLEMMDITNKIYARALETPNEVRALCEAGLIKEAIKYQRKLYQGTGYIPSPMFWRADMLDLETVVEYNIPGGGLGLMESIRSVAIKEKKFGTGLAVGWAEGLKNLTGKQKPVVYFPIHNEECARQVRYFLERLKTMSIDARTYRWDEPFPDPKNVDVVLRMCMNRSVKKKGWDKLWRAYTVRDVLIEPPPTAIYDSKIAHTLPFYPETSNGYPDHIRKLFPNTWVVTPGLEVPLTGRNGDSVAIESLPYVGGKRRSYVIKYAGADGDLDRASKSVFQLDGKRVGKYSAEEVVLNAILDWENKQNPWILQPRLKRPFDVVYLDDASRGLVYSSMRARIMPCYSLGRSGAQVIGGSVLFSRKWKVHGQRDSVHCAIQVN